jgi:hypothetical protein
VYTQTDQQDSCKGISINLKKSKKEGKYKLKEFPRIFSNFENLEFQFDRKYYFIETKTKIHLQNQFLISDLNGNKIPNQIVQMNLNENQKMN